jgi:hypothetical protein
MQGVVSSVTVTSGYQEILIKMVKDAYVDLWVYRDWPWTRESETFNTVQGTTEYSLATIVGIGDTVDIRKWVPGMILYVDSDGYRTPLRRVGYNYYVRNDIIKQDQSTPALYAEDPVDSHLYINPPAGAYSIEAHFYRYPVELAANGDTPDCPDSFHRYIAYAGAYRLAKFMGNPNLSQQLALQADVMLGNLLRGHNPAKRVRTLGIV